MTISSSANWGLDIAQVPRKKILLTGMWNSTLIIFVALLVLVGWVLDSDFLIRIRPDFVSFKPNTAVVFIFFGFSYLLIALQNLRSFSKKRTFFIYLLAGLGTSLAFVSLSEDLLNLNLSIDTLLTKKDFLKNGSPNPGRISPLAAICFLFLGSNLLLYAKRGESGRLTAFTSLVVILLAFGTFVSYLYGAPYLSGLGEYNSMAFHTSILFMLAGIAALLVFLSRHPLTIFLKGPSAKAARSLFPLVVIGPILSGWARWIAEDYDLFEGKFATAVLVTLLVALMALVTYFLLSRIDQQYKKQLETEKLSKERKELLNFKEKLVSSLVHDIRSPLTLVRMSAEIINRPTSSSDRAIELGHRIIKSIDRCDRMLKDLLDSARLESGHEITVTFSPLNMYTVLQQAIQNVKDSMRVKNDIRLHCPKDLIWNSNQDFLIRITENLLSNAIKYGEEDKPITVTGTGVKEEFHLLVHNWGNPIPKVETDDLFELFSRQKHGKGPTMSWGVGLTAVKSLTTSLGGSVEVRSSAEEGTTFRVKLPLRKG